MATVMSTIAFSLSGLCTLHHVPVSIVCDGVDVWGNLMALLALVQLDDLLRVNRQHFVGVHHHTEQA